MEDESPKRQVYWGDLLLTISQPDSSREIYKKALLAALYGASERTVRDLCAGCELPRFLDSSRRRDSLLPSSQVGQDSRSVRSVIELAGGRET